MRDSTFHRKTSETEYRAALSLDGSGRCEIRTGSGFLDHMLEAFAFHGRFDVTLVGGGDERVDGHHAAEDAGIALGSAFRVALGDFRGIERYGSVALPMDEALTLCAVDISGRARLSYGLRISAHKIGDFDVELAWEFFEAFAREARFTIHLHQLAGENGHHILESAFKAFGRALRAACARSDTDAVPSAKGALVE